MAVETPVLDREIQAENKMRYNYDLQKETDEVHNALIKQRYAQLINPENKMSDLRPEMEPVQAYVPSQAFVPAREESIFDTSVSSDPTKEHRESATPYFVQSARTNADIFRADSFVNQRRESAHATAETVSEYQDPEEEENEDLRPTSTTIQYRTAEAKRTVEEGAVVTTTPKKHTSLSKRDKIAIVAVVAVIVTLFALIIINSALIAGLNNDINYIESSLKTAKNAYEQVHDRLNEYTANLGETVRELAENLGMYR